MTMTIEERSPVSPDGTARADGNPDLADATMDRDVAFAPFAPPLFVLAPPRSYSSLVCAMLGQHPQLFGLPELHLFSADTIHDWWAACARASASRKDGALRAIAQLFFGGQTEETVQQARGWLRRRSHISTALLLEMLAQRVYPRVPVEKSPSITYSTTRMKRAHVAFPDARYLHLLRHPRTQAESMLKQMEKKQARGARVSQYWADPPLGWHANHRHIAAFLELVLPDRTFCVRAEDLLADPDAVLADIARWLGVRDDPEAIDAMKHPERSPFAFVGPRGAGFGADRNFLESPEFRPGAVRAANLDDPVSWMSDGSGLPPRVKRMARDFGYE